MINFSRINNRIRRARKMAGLSQAQTAKMLNFPLSFVSEIEDGSRSVSAQEVKQLAGIFDVRTSWLLNEDPDGFAVYSNKFQLAAKELQKLNPEDVPTFLTILSSMQTTKTHD
jgi:transcriptional regulator with XRE-family HTH domain